MTLRYEGLRPLWAVHAGVSAHADRLNVVLVGACMVAFAARCGPATA